MGSGAPMSLFLHSQRDILPVPISSPHQSAAKGRRVTSLSPQATPAQPRDQPWRPDLRERALVSQELGKDLVTGQGDSIPDLPPASPREGGRDPGPGTLQRHSGSKRSSGLSPSPASRQRRPDSDSQLSETGRSPAAAAGGGCPRRACLRCLPSLQECVGVDSQGRQRSRARERAPVALPSPFSTPGLIESASQSPPVAFRCAAQAQTSSPLPEARKPGD